jgi:divalent metal cation (Fe/Co/Zn/Cd) transporter
MAAFVGISIALIFGEGYETADDWAALVAAGFIYYNSYLIFRPALGEIMDEHLHDDLVLEIRQIAQKVDGVVDTEKCFIRKTGMTFWVDLHLIVDGNLSVKKGHEIAHNVKDAIRNELPEIAEILMHVEPDD